MTGAIVFPDPLPAWVRSNHRRGAECRVYDALKAQLAAPWRVFYSRPWLGLDRDGLEREGEADFVLAHPDLGMLVIEVKGGRVGRDARQDQWYSIDGDGIRHRIRNPVSQASRNKHALLESLKAAPGWGTRFIAAAHAVLLPDCLVPADDLGPDLPSRLFGGIDDMARLRSWVEERLRDQGGCGRRVSPMGRDGIEALTQHFARSFMFEQPAAASLQYAEDEIRVLTDQQVQVLNMLDQVPRLAIPGPAGTGKTTLAVEKARRLARAGKRTLLLCYNRPLGRQLQRELGDEPNLTMRTFHALCAEMAARAGMPLPGNGDLDGRPGLFRRDLPRALREALQRRPAERFDAIVVDEGQDFEEGWLPAVEALLADPVQGILYVFHDDNQRVHSRMQAITAHVPNFGLRLSRILRNTRTIVETVSPLLPRPFDPAGPQGMPVRWVETGGQLSSHDIARQLQELVHECHILPGDIAVLVPDEAYRERLVTGGTIESWRVTDAEHPPGRTVICDSIRRFKGLERPVVIVVEPEHVLATPEVLYVGLTRARVLLVLLASRGRLAQLRLLLDCPSGLGKATAP